MPGLGSGLSDQSLNSLSDDLKFLVPEDCEIPYTGNITIDNNIIKFFIIYS